MAEKQKSGKGGSKKHGRNKRSLDQNLSAYVRGKIDFSAYWRRTHGIKFDNVLLQKRPE